MHIQHSRRVCDATSEQLSPFHFDTTAGGFLSSIRRGQKQGKQGLIRVAGLAMPILGERSPAVSIVDLMTTGAKAW
jgi:hypothetical protein